MLCDSLRQNKETHLAIGQDEVVNKIEFRIARYTFLPGYNGEPLHVMYTTPGHGYGMPHLHPSTSTLFKLQGRMSILLCFFAIRDPGSQHA